MNSSVEENNSEISFLDIFIFFKRSYKLIALIGLLGVAASSTYLFVTPKQYQASAQIHMAQIGTANNNTNIINPLGVNIEEPQLLIVRLSSPASYTAEVNKVCGLDSAKDAQAILSKSVNLSIPKGSANVVDLKIIGVSPEASINCAQAVFDLIKTTQAQIIKPYVEKAKAKLLYNQERLTKAKDLLRMVDKSGSAMGAAYLLLSDEIKFLLAEISTLKDVVSKSDDMATRLVAPIYASDDPIAPKKRNILLAGLFCGLFLGLLIAFLRQLISTIKAQLENNTLSK